MNNLLTNYAFNGLLTSLMPEQELSFIYQITFDNNKLNFAFQIQGKTLGDNLHAVKDLTTEFRKNIYSLLSTKPQLCFGKLSNTIDQQIAHLLEWRATLSPQGILLSSGSNIDNKKNLTATVLPVCICIPRL